VDFMMRPGCRARAAAATVGRAWTRRALSSTARTDGFHEALPRGDFVAPIVFGAIYGFSWWMAGEGNIKGLAEKVEINTDPTQNPTPTQLFHHIWPYVAGSLGTLFDSVACRFSQTGDMDWLCNVALNDDTNAAVALSVLTPPAENSPAFLRAILERPGAFRRVKEIVQIYKTLPREQHDDVVVNAAILCAKAAAVPSLREETLPLSDFVWMMPADKAHIYTQYGVEGLGALWHVEKRAFLCSGGVLRIHELLDGPTLRPHKPDSSAIIQLMAHRLFVQLSQDSEALLQIATIEERRLVADLKAAGTARPRKTIWQAAGVHRGETELERNARVRASEIEAVRGSIELLSQSAPHPQLAALEQYTSALCVTSAGVLGALYGGVRGYCRAWLSDVTPSVCKEVAAHVSRRSALGAMLLVAVFEMAPQLKKQALALAAAPEVTAYSADGALQQLIAVDVAYLAAVAVLNFAFPYILVPVALNPAQLLVMPPAEPSPEAASK